MFVNELNCTVTFQNGATFIAPPRFNAGRQGENLATKVVMRLKNIGLKENKNFTLGYHFEIVDGLGVKYCSPHYGLYCPNGGSDDEIIDFEIPKSITKAGGVATLYAYIGISDDERELITPGLELDFSDVETEKIQVSQNEENQYRGLNALLQQAKTYTEETENNLKGSTEALAEIKSVVEQSTELLENTKEIVNGKADKSEIPQKVSQLENDKGYLVEDDIKNKVNKSKILDYITYEVGYYDEGEDIQYNDNEVVITDCSTDISGTYIIPDTIEGYPVTAICTSAFENCTSLKGIVLPNSITYLSYRSFHNCTSLTSIIIPNGVTAFYSDSVFGNCTSLERVILPEGLTYIGCTTFRGCTKLKNIVIPNSVTVIEDTAFENCTALTSINIPVGVTRIMFSFDGCTSLKDIYYGGTKEDWDNADMRLWWIEGEEEYNYDTFKDDVTIHYKYGDVPIPTENTDAANKEYVDESFRILDSGKANKNKILDYITYEIIDNSVTITECDTSISGELLIPQIIEGYPVTAIGAFAFNDCRSLTRIIIGNNVTTIGEAAFECCSSVISVDMSNGITHIGTNAFAYCSSLVRIKIPDSVIGIGSNAFEGCSALESITIPSGIAEIDSMTFSGCHSLASITIPDSVTKISYYAFESCNSLCDVYYSGTKEQWENINISDVDNDNYYLLSATKHFANTYETYSKTETDAFLEGKADKPKSVAFADGDTITLADNTTYYAESEISSLTVIYPETNFICSLEFTLASEGDVTITLPTSKYIGGAPTFANGETWELNIMNGVVVGGLVE